MLLVEVEETKMPRLTEIFLCYLTSQHLYDQTARTNLGRENADWEI